MYTEPEMGILPSLQPPPYQDYRTASQKEVDDLKLRVRDLEILVAALWGFHLDEKKRKQTDD